MAFDSFVLSDIDPVLRSIEKISLRASLAGCTVSSSLDFESHEQFWDVNTDTAFFSVKLDPNTRQRLAIRTNRQLAAFFGSHSEEFLARTANIEYPFPSTDLDALLLVLYRAVQTACRGGTTGAAYYRMRIGRGALARVCTSFVRDGAGRVCEVRRTFREIGPDEYDTATRLRPEACPMFALGDRRSGRQLLADFAADNAATGVSTVNPVDAAAKAVCTKAVLAAFIELSVLTTVGTITDDADPALTAPVNTGLTCGAPPRLDNAMAAEATSERLFAACNAPAANVTVLVKPSAAIACACAKMPLRRSGGVLNEAGI